MLLKRVNLLVRYDSNQYSCISNPIELLNEIMIWCGNPGHLHGQFSQVWLHKKHQYAINDYEDPAWIQYVPKIKWILDLRTLEQFRVKTTLDLNILLLHIWTIIILPILVSDCPAGVWGRARAHTCVGRD